MKDLRIDCRGIDSIDPIGQGWLSLDLVDVDLSFITDIPTEEVVKHLEVSSSELLELMDINEDELVDHLELIKGKK